MKTVISFNTINRSTSGPGAFMRAAKWYWDEVTDMAAAAGFDSIALSMVPDTPNDARNGAPVCTGALNSQYGSVPQYRDFLKEHGISSVSSMMISGQSMMDTMFENGTSMNEFFQLFYDYAKDVCEALKTLGGTFLIVSPTPAIGPLIQATGADDRKLEQFFREAADCVNQIGRMSSDTGIRTCVKSDFWTLLRGRNIQNFMELTDRDNVYFVPDTAQIQIAEADCCALIDALTDRISCVIFSDTRYVDTTDNYRSISPEYPQSGPMQRCYHDVGYGSVDFSRIYTRLQQHHFDGTVILESRYSLDVPRAILRMRTFWNRLNK